MNTEVETGSPDTSAVLSIGAGLPPVPLRLVKRIQAGEFIDMSELLRVLMLEGDKEEKRTKRRQVANILECFSIFAAVRAQKYQDMLGYLAFIVEAHME